MEIKGKIEKVGFLFGTFNMLKEDIPKSIKKEENKQKNAVIDRHTANGLYNRKNNAIWTLQCRKRTIYLHGNVIQTAKCCLKIK